MILISGIPLYLALFAISGRYATDIYLPNFIEEAAEAIWKIVVFIIWYIPPIVFIFKPLGLVECGGELGCLPNAGAIIVVGVMLSLIMYVLISLLHKRERATS